MPPALTFFLWGWWERKVYTVERGESIDILLRNVPADLTFFSFYNSVFSYHFISYEMILRFHLYFSSPVILSNLAPIATTMSQNDNRQIFWRWLDRDIALTPKPSRRVLGGVDGSLASPG